MNDWDDGGKGKDGEDGQRLDLKPFFAPRPFDPDAASPTESPHAVRWYARRTWGARFAATRLGAIRDWLVHSYLQEMQAGNQFSWYIVALAVGAAIYLILPAEPSLLALSGLLLAAAVYLLLKRRTADRTFGLTLLVMLIAGVWAGSFKSLLADGSRLDRERTATVTGWILDEETVLKGATRMTIKVAEMSGHGLPREAIPHLVTVTFRASTPSFEVGDSIHFIARLQPLSGPVMPGGYDFARRAFYEGRGGTGYALGKVGLVDIGPSDLVTRITAAIANIRRTMSTRIRAALPGAEGAIAAAIIVGEQRGIPDAENDALRMSGLPHMITIAGLHMSIVAGCVFAAMRWLLALFPAIALRYPTKKWAAAAALGATTFYVLISGGHLSAERAYIMSAIMLLAILFGRPALTMRNLGLSAIVLIIRNPVQVVEPGFLMSFLAVMALIASYRAWADYRSNRATPSGLHDDNLLTYVLRKIADHGLGAVASALIATIATASVTADQFYRLSPYSALSNLIVLPVIDMIAMPAAVLSCLAMPFGLEVIPLKVLGWAISFMDSIGFMAAELPGGNGLIGRIHPWANGLAIAGLCWLCLWQRPWRLLGAIPMILALGLAPFASRPDILIDANAIAVAVRDSDNHLKALGVKQDRFAVANWLTADAAPNAPADPRVPLDPHLSDGWACDGLGCVFNRPANGSEPVRRIAVVTDPRGFDEDCLRADIVVTRLVAPDYCSDTAVVFDHDRLSRTGAVALTFNGTKASSPPDVASIQSDTGPDKDAQDMPNLEIATALPTQQRAWMRPLEPTAKPKLPNPPAPAPTAAIRPTTDAMPPEADSDNAVTKDIDTADLLARSDTNTQPTLSVHPIRRGVKPRPLLLDPTQPPDDGEP